MAQTRVLLREDIDNLGARGEIVRVKAGYARNYLLPRKMAVEATAGNVKQIEAERAALMKREARDKATAEQQAAQVKSISLNFTRKVGEHGILYGSVTSMDIAEALRAKGYEIDRRRIQLREPIKETGEFTVNVKLHREVVVEVPVTVTGEGGEIVPRTEPGATQETAANAASAAGNAAGAPENTTAEVAASAENGDMEAAASSDNQ
jgi:large subunit ribosomal protein L9